MDNAIETTNGLVWNGERAPFAKAFVAAQKATEAVKKASTNPAFRSKYADLAGVVEAVVPALNDNGIAVIQSPAFEGDFVALTTILLHESGSSVSGVLRIHPSKMDPQGIGSAITYARRYALISMSGAAPEDDDGNAAPGPRESQKTPSNKSAREFAIKALNAASDLEDLGAIWGKNAKGWRELLSEEDFKLVEAAKESLKITLGIVRDEVPAEEVFK